MGQSTARTQNCCIEKGSLMTEAIVWGVIWLIATFGVAWLIYAVLAIGGGALAVGTDAIWIAPVGFGLGAIGAVAWFIFGATQTVLQIISIIQLAIAG